MIQNKTLYSLSPCESYLASAMKEKLIVHQVQDTLQLQHYCSWTNCGSIYKLRWSPDSSKILISSKGSCQIYSVDDSNWKCTLQGGTLECEDFLWSPDSMSVIALSANNTIECEVTNISGLSWVDDGSIAYWDTLFSRKVCISLLCGTHIAKFENIPSLEKIDVSVSGGLIAMSNGKEIQIINVPTLRVLGKAPILQCIDDSVNIVVYREVLNLECVLQYETVNSRPYVVGKQKHEKEQLIHKMSFSYDGTFLSTVVSSSLSSVWIWDVKKVAPVCLITFINNVTDLKWCSTSNHLAVATGSDSIFIWSPTDSLSHSLEWTNQKAFPGKHLQWSDPGNLLLVYSKGCYKILSIFN
ncbi:uncharacterized protein LOC136033505 isoform X2 [Artemia franciscana]|uniref:uncharacterized protein LOC136033505 isoform X2 n=1 Tax=Artemia franciscana TaxID=6661 RepID=UPI0032DA10F7